ncbi:MAG: O-methyltransferase [Flavipsychrobacter sp.]|jgi:predicted O-methyltransferase YrrM|nr:O-methyltransferase [Flavipsychrobacter sp.]
MASLLLSKELNEYAEQYTTPETPVMAALNRETNLKRGDAVMLSGHLQGAVLQMLSHMIKPECILEIGTFTGYSAICLAQGLQQGGKLHTIEIDEELQDMASKYITEAGLRDRIVQHIGAASEIIPALNEAFDMVFIDADKLNYELYYDLVFDKLPIGGYILADNVLYDGEVVLPEGEQTKNARCISAFNAKVRADRRIEHLLLPVRDGLMIVRKIKQ